jgi:hypothetical protein
VPIAIHWPGKTQAASSSEHPVSVLDFYPTTGIFQTKGEVDTLILAGPTHLKEIGFYDPAVHTDYYEVSDIALFKLP